MSRIASRELGSGPPLLLINGYAATGADWDPSFLEALSAHSRVILPDNPDSDFEMPVLAAAETADEVIPAANALQIAAASEHAWLARFAGAGHGLMAQEPKRLAALIGSFLGR